MIWQWNSIYIPIILRFTRTRTLLVWFGTMLMYSILHLMLIYGNAKGEIIWNGNVVFVIKQFMTNSSKFLFLKNMFANSLIWAMKIFRSSAHYLKKTLWSVYVIFEEVKIHSLYCKEVNKCQQKQTILLYIGYYVIVVPIEFYLIMVTVTLEKKRKKYEL